MDMERIGFIGIDLDVDFGRKDLLVFGEESRRTRTQQHTRAALLYFCSTVTFTIFPVKAFAFCL
jgi:hypothetical protein